MTPPVGRSAARKPLVLDDQIVRLDGLANPYGPVARGGEALAEDSGRPNRPNLDLGSFVLGSGRISASTRRGSSSATAPKSCSGLPPMRLARTCLGSSSPCRPPRTPVARSQSGENHRPPSRQPVSTRH
jgi:hypothetical protein